MLPKQSFNTVLVLPTLNICVNNLTKVIYGMTMALKEFDKMEILDVLEENRGSLPQCP